MVGLDKNLLKSRSKLVAMLMTASLLFLFATKALAWTLTDQVGRQVSVPETSKPLRVVSLAPGITETIFFLGKGELVKGVVQHSDYPAKALEIPVVGSFVAPDLERILAIKPDLCIAIRDGKSKDIVNRIEALGVPVYVAEPKDIYGIMEMILAFGEMLDASKKAKEIVSTMKGCLESLEAELKKIENKPKVFYQIGVSPMVSVGRNTFSHQLIELSGGKNIFDYLTGYPHVDVERVFALMPDVIIIATMERGGRFEELKKEWEKRQAIPAAANKKIYVISADLLNRPSPRIIKGILLMAKLIHPDLSLSSICEQSIQTLLAD